jgi:hypothetical protein
VNFPPRVILALTVIAALLGLGIWAIRAVAVSGALSPAMKWLVGLIAVALVALVVGCIVFIARAYWD